MLQRYKSLFKESLEFDTYNNFEFTLEDGREVLVGATGSPGRDDYGKTGIDDFETHVFDADTKQLINWNDISKEDHIKIDNEAEKFIFDMHSEEF